MNLDIDPYHWCILIAVYYFAYLHGHSNGRFSERLYNAKNDSTKLSKL